MLSDKCWATKLSDKSVKTWSRLFSCTVEDEKEVGMVMFFCCQNGATKLLKLLHQAQWLQLQPDKKWFTLLPVCYMIRVLLKYSCSSAGKAVILFLLNHTWLQASIQWEPLSLADSPLHLALDTVILVHARSWSSTDLVVVQCMYSLLVISVIFVDI